jgi:hypothetical protein
VHQFVGQLKVGDGIPFHSFPEIPFQVPALPEAMIKIEHRCHAVETETIEVEFLHPEFDVGEEEPHDFHFAVIKTF